MNTLVMTNIGRIPGKDGVALLNGEEVTKEVFKVEINVSEIKLFRYDMTRRTAEGGPVEIETLIDELKVN
jgi:hypothetical protein